MTITIKKLLLCQLDLLSRDLLDLHLVDPNQFENPFEFNHLRDNLMSNVLSFNSVGFEQVGIGTRVCPGRNVALEIFKKVLLKSRE